MASKISKKVCWKSSIFDLRNIAFFKKKTCLLLKSKRFLAGVGVTVGKGGLTKPRTRKTRVDLATPIPLSVSTLAFPDWQQSYARRPTVPFAGGHTASKTPEPF